jgi:hypothetical protein
MRVAAHVKQLQEEADALKADSSIFESDTTPEIR